MKRLFKFKSKLLLIIILILFSLVLSGCKKKDTPTPTDSIVPSDRPITLIWWNLFEPKENVQPVIDAYQAKHPNVTIEYSQKDIKDYQTSLDKVLTDGIPESTPDIFTIPNNQIGRYNNYTISAPTQVIDEASFKKNFYSVIYQDCVKGSFVRAIPIGVDSMAIIYNKDLLQAKGYSAPSDDWFKLQDQALALTQKTGDKISTYGISIGAYDNSEFWFDTFNLLLMQSKVKMLSDSGNDAVFAQDAASEEAVTYIQDFEKKGIWNKEPKLDIALFLEKKLAMYIAPSWRLLDIIAYNNQYKLGINYGIAPVPQLATLEEEKFGWASYWVETVAVDSQNYKVAWDFLNFTTQPEQLRLLNQKAATSRAFGQMSPRIDMKAEVASNKDLSVYINEVEQAKSWNMVDGNLIKLEFAKWINKTSTKDQAQLAVTNIIKSTGILKKTGT